jgi:hypothetical protein
MNVCWIWQWDWEWCKNYNALLKSTPNKQNKLNKQKENRTENTPERQNYMNLSIISTF